VDKDVVLPALGNTGQNETFVIVASTDEKRADILRKRICGQLERCPELQTNSVFKVSVVPVELPSPETEAPVEKLVQRVADGINEMIMTIFRRHSSEG
jgi:hypothetical protein